MGSRTWSNRRARVWSFAINETKHDEAIQFRLRARENPSRADTQVQGATERRVREDEPVLRAGRFARMKNCREIAPPLECARLCQGRGPSAVRRSRRQLQDRRREWFAQ